eukprot:185583_1
MSDEFAFGFDCDELQSDEEDQNADNYIPPAEDELKPASTITAEGNAIQFVDARFYKEKPLNIFSQDFDISYSHQDEYIITNPNTNTDNNNHNNEQNNEYLKPTPLDNCPGNHGLNEYITKNANIICNNCNTKCLNDCTLFGCTQCDYNLCDKCVVKVKTLKQSTSNDTVRTDESHQSMISLGLESMIEYVCEMADEFDGYSDSDIDYEKMENNTPININRQHTASPIDIGIKNMGVHQPAVYERMNTLFSDSDFHEETDNDEYNYEECGIGLDQRTLPFDFEKPLKWKPINTLVINIHMQQIKEEINNSKIYNFVSDSESDDSSDSSTHSTFDTDTDYDSIHDDSYSGHYYHSDSMDIEMDMTYEQPSDDEDDIFINFGGINNTTPHLKRCKRFWSTFTPAKYDIILMEASPLRIYGINNLKDINRISLEYLHSALLDQHKLYEKVWQTLLRNSFSVRCGNLNGNLSNIKRISEDDGCKIFQFIGHCCNPIQVKRESKIYDSDNNIFKIYSDLTKHILNPLDEDYILLECCSNKDNKSVIDGEWICVSELSKYFCANQNDIVIIMSPQHEQMGRIFLDMGYSYVIAIKTFEQNNRHTQHNWQLLDFLHHFYSAILNRECLSRAFELAKTASKSSINDLQARQEMIKI